MIGYCYINHVREFIRTGENVFKIGRTSKHGNTRLSQYPKGTVEKIKVFVTDCYKCEKEIMKEFDMKFKQMPYYGREYYEGNIDDMLKVFTDITSKFSVKEHNELLNDRDELWNDCDKLSNNCDKLSNDSNESSNDSNKSSNDSNESSNDSNESSNDSNESNDDELPNDGDALKTIKKHTCDICKYETNRKHNLHIHEKGNRHIKLMALQDAKTIHAQNSIIPIKHNPLIDFLENRTETLVVPNPQDDKSQKTKIGKIHMCEFCNKQLATRHSLFRHKKSYCKEKNKQTNSNSQNSTKHMISELAEFIENKFNALENTITNNINVITDNININTQPTGIINYLATHFKNAPSLKLLHGSELTKILQSRDAELLIKKVIDQYNHKTLHKFIGDLIINKYIKNDKCTQSIWCSDVSRLSFIVRIITKNCDNVWISDVQGIKVIKLIITPIITKIESLIYNVEGADEILIDIKLKKFNTPILKHIASSFYLDALI